VPLFTVPEPEGTAVLQLSNVPAAVYVHISPSVNVPLIKLRLTCAPNEW
jgi:hypothetical protein